MNKQSSDENSLAVRWKRTRWFNEARFGMFIHWGIYAIPARGEWVQSNEAMDPETYAQYALEFNPVDYDPDAWAQTARAAGMRYAVLTAKHHDGFCLFDSQFTDFKSTNTPARRDLVRDFLDAFRRHGLKVGLYYSLPDWHHPDYPAYGDRQHPMRNNPDWKHRHHDFDHYVTYMHNQVRELCSNYGKLDIMWFDFSYHDKRGEAWRATELVKMVRSLQPQIIIDNRLGGNLFKDPPDYFAGDFHGPEQTIPREGCFTEKGEPVPWEACITLNNSWGYCAHDKQYKSPATVIRTLVNCVSKGGNLLVNMGPDARGRIPQEAISILERVGQWLQKNGDSIYGCGPAGLPKPEWGRWTRKENILYAHVQEQVIGQINLPGLRDKIRRARLLADGSEVFLRDFWNQEVDTLDAPEDIFMSFQLPPQGTYELPDPVDTVVALELKDS